MATPPPTTHPPPPPDSILIIGAGVFGLSTTLSLLTNPRYARTKITLLDPYLPPLDPPTPSRSRSQSRPSPSRRRRPPPPQPTQNPHAASADSSRIIRPDYASPPYARLALAAQRHWRAGFGAPAVYSECGVILSADARGSAYAERAFGNAQGLGCRVERLRGRGAVGACLGTGGEGGEGGYVNWGSGWVEAGRAMGGLLGGVVRVVEAGGRAGVVFKRGWVRRLCFGDDDGGGGGGGERGKRRVVGAVLDGGEEVLAALTIVAAGAWSGALVDLRGRAEARGQVLAYVAVTEEEKERLRDMPVVLNLSTGMFAIPPVEDRSAAAAAALEGGKEGTKGDAKWFVKIARHAFGYANPTTVSPEGPAILASLPAAAFSPIPREGDSACRAFLRQTIPWLGERPFSASRLCWYSDTPTGDFLVDHHPGYGGLFLATGGSGHAFKFLPVLGDRVVEAVEGRLGGGLGPLWGWRGEGVRPFRGCEDGSRVGERGLVLGVEWGKGEGGRSRL